MPLGLGEVVGLLTNDPLGRLKKTGLATSGSIATVTILAWITGSRPSAVLSAVPGVQVGPFLVETNREDAAQWSAFIALVCLIALPIYSAFRFGFLDYAGATRNTNRSMTLPVSASWVGFCVATEQTPVSWRDAPGLLRSPATATMFDVIVVVLLVLLLGPAVGAVVKLFLPGRPLTTVVWSFIGSTVVRFYGSLTLSLVFVVVYFVVVPFVAVVKVIFPLLGLGRSDP